MSYKRVLEGKVSKNYFVQGDFAALFGNLEKNLYLCARINRRMTDMPRLFSHKICSRRLFLLLLIIGVTLFQLLPGGGDLYAQYLYPVIVKPLSTFSGWFPFSVSGVFYTLGILVLLLYPIIALSKHQQKKRRILMIELELIAWLYVWFYFAWGLNYWQSDFYHRTKTSRVEYSKEALQCFADEYVQNLNASYAVISTKDEAMVHREIVKAYRSMGEKLGIHTPFSETFHVKTMLYTPLYSKVGVTGTMGPFFDEFIINDDLLPCEYAFTYAHELSHLLGIAREGEANFYGYLACISSEEPAIRFSGYLSIFHYVLRAMRGIGTEEYEAFLGQVRPEILELDKQRYEHWSALYSETLGNAQNQVYDYYLRSHQVEGGRKNYSEVIGLLISMKEREHEAL